MTDHTKYFSGKEHDGRKKSVPRASPGAGNTKRLRPLDDFERAAELSAIDPFPTVLKISKKRSPTPTRHFNIKNLEAEPEQPEPWKVLENSPLTPLEHTIARAFNSQSPKDSQRRKTLHIKHPERVTADSDCNPFDKVKDSSDSWSGDEIFLKRPAELQLRQTQATEQFFTCPIIAQPRPETRHSRFFRPSPAKLTSPLSTRSEQSRGPSHVEDWSKGMSHYVPSFSTRF